MGVGIALHIFVVMMETGATQGGLRKKKIFALGAIFLGVQICMQTCGILLTWWIKQYLHIAALERIYKTVYVILLIWIGTSFSHGCGKQTFRMSGNPLP